MKDASGGRHAGLDAIVVGAGLNGLVAANLLARAGLRVSVLERAPTVGGTVGTDELAPGFRVPSCIPSLELLHPRLPLRLALQRFGLELLPTRGGTVVLDPDGQHLRLGSDSPGDRARLGSRDRGALQELERFRQRLARAWAPVVENPLPALGSRNPAEILTLLRRLLGLRRLGRRDFLEALRFLPSSLSDALDERLESAPLKAALGATALRGSWLGPRSAGSAYALLHHTPAWSSGLVPPPVHPRGGPGSLSRALAEAAICAGATVRTEEEVTAIAVEGGRVEGVTTASGETVEAPIVVSALDPKRTFLGLVEPSALEPDFVAQVAEARSRGSVSIASFALEALPDFKGLGAAELGGRLQIGDTLEGLERSADACKYGELPDRPLLEITIPSLTDPTLAPEGRHVMTVWIQHTPYPLREGSWDAARELLETRLLSRLETHSPGFSDRIVGHRLQTPVDLEARFGLTQGCLSHLEMALDQLLFLRPVAGWHRHRTPIGGLYLCGAGTHPGGGASGLSGSNAARVVLVDRRRKGI